MSNQRRKIGGRIGRTQERGPFGRGICRWCTAEVPAGRRTFCSDSCVHEWRLRTDPSYLRDQVFARDKGICQVCALNTIEIYREFRALPSWKRVQLRRRLDIPSGRTSLWDADHVVPVAEGGGECTLENLRTLCIWCHQNETGKLRRRLLAKHETVTEGNQETGKPGQGTTRAENRACVPTVLVVQITGESQ